MDKIEKLVAPYFDNHSGCGGASYDEVINKINEIIDALNGKEDPELREINDEEIRKDLIGGLMWQRDNLKSEGPHDNNLILPGFCLTVGEHLAYLKKQKEQKAIPIPPPCWESAIQEQKPVEKQDYSGLTDFERAIHRGFLCAGVENVPVTIIKETAQECLAQIKPAEWSEEDEENRQLINAILWNSIGKHIEDSKYDFTVTQGDATKLIQWLKSLRPQKKEDLAIEGIQGVSGHLDPAGVWKPTPAHLEALEFVIADYRESGCDTTANYLQEIYDEIKKL